MAKDITIKSPPGTEIFYPKTVSDLVYDDGTRKALSVQRKEDLINLIEKLGDSGSLATLFGYTRYNGYVPTYDSITNTITFTSSTNTKYIVYIAPITKGTIYRRTAQSTVNRTVNIAYTQTEITSGEDLLATTFDNVTREANTTVFDTISIAPYDGYLMIYMYNQDWVSGSTTSYKLDLSKIIDNFSEVDDEIADIINFVGFEDITHTAAPFNGLDTATQTYTTLVDEFGNPFICHRGHKYTVTAHYTDASGEGYATNTKGGGTVYNLSVIDSGGTRVTLKSQSALANAKITADISYTFTALDSYDGSYFYFWSRVLQTDLIYITITEKSSDDSLYGRLNNIDTEIEDIQEQQETFVTTTHKVDALEDKLHYTEYNDYYCENIYTDPTYVQGTIQPTGTVGSTTHSYRVSPSMKVVSDKIRFTFTPQNISGLDGDDLTYFVNVRLVAYNGTSWTQINTHQSKTKLFDVTPYTQFRFTPFYISPATNNQVATTKNDEIVAFIEALSVRIEYLNSDNTPAVLYDGVDIVELDERVTALEEGSGLGTDIISLNNRTETIFKLRQLNKPLLNGSSTTQGNMWNIVHFSDIHDSPSNLRRIMEYYNEYEAYFDGILNTGDSVGSEWRGTSPLTTLLSENVGIEKVLNTIGNHDTSEYTATSSHHWADHVGVDAYNKFIKPFVSNWNVTQPENAEENGYCYYYKDYAMGANGNNLTIRLIVMDAMELGSHAVADIPTSTQITWLHNVLEDAKTNGYQVVLASHFGYITTLVQCPFTSLLNKSLADPPNNPSYYVLTATRTMLDEIGNFISGGGIFICMLAGHSHIDKFGTYEYTVTNDNVETVYHIPVLRVDTANATTQAFFSDIRRVRSGTNALDKSYDLFNIFSVDPYKKRFVVSRVGADYDSMMHHIGHITYSYANHTKDDNLLSSN